MTPSSPSDAAKGRWPAILTTERANPLCQRNPGWGGRSTARRPVAAVNQFFLTHPVFVNRLTRDMTPAAALADGIVPAPSALTDVADDAVACAQDLQRERCLLFVTLTRARDHLYISYSGSPSAFLR